MYNTYKWYNYKILDECTTKTHQCDTTTTSCVDNTGDDFGYTCPCRDGFFKVNENDKTCHDMNECNPPDSAHNNHDCDTHATCTNNFGNFACKCNDGWKGNGKTCTNVDECAADTLNQCDAETTTCDNNVGSVFGYQCLCKLGYKKVDNKVGIIGHSKS